MRHDHQPHKKQTTDQWTQGHDEAMRLEPIRKLTLEDALGYI